MAYTGKRKLFLLTAYSFFCTAALIAVNGVENLSLLWIAKWFALFFTGLPFIIFLYRQQIQQEKLAQMDDVTGLTNHRRLLEKLEQELVRAKRYHHELSVMMIDVDNFKKINDRCGHLAGDKVLGEIGTILTKNVRSIDTAGRYGGDEFLVILPHTSRDEAEHLAWRLKKNVAAHPFRVDHQQLHVMMSLGVSSLQNLGEEPNPFSLIHRADQAMFSAKNAKHQPREKTMAA